MSEYTSEDLTNLLRAVLAGWNERDGWDYWSHGTTEQIPLIGLVEVVEYQHGSWDYEDGIPHVIVFRVSDYDYKTLYERVRYYRKSGYVQSYSSIIDWSGEFREVVPKEKVVYEYV